MRIIAGEFKGRKLLLPEGDVTRPITDRVKQSLFDILTPLIPDARVYDCFAGTGSMGLESLSRSAVHATFFEQNRSALARLRRNIETLALRPRSTVVAHDLFHWFNESPGAGTGAADVVFLDPPYRFIKEQAAALRKLATQIAAGHLATDGVIVLRHDATERLDLPELQRYDERVYGGMMLEFLRRA